MENEINIKIKEQFGREAVKYVNSPVHANPEDLKFILKFIEPKRKWLVLDIATGGGHLALTLSPKVSKVFSTDLTEQMLDQVTKQAKEKKINNLETKQEDVHNLSFKSDTFDLVCSRIAPHHFHNVNKALEEMSRVTKRDGYIFIQDTSGQSGSVRAQDGIKFINPSNAPTIGAAFNISYEQNLLIENTMKK